MLQQKHCRILYACVKSDKVSHAECDVPRSLFSSIAMKVKGSLGFKAYSPVAKPPS